MYECPNCAGNLKFDIARQQLFCAYCETSMDPYSFHKEQDAEEYEATIFTCPQCGGEIISDDTTAATFCSFCDGATILDSRISKERRPGYIIPFTKTKEDCKKSYAKMMRRAIFAPKELKDAEQIEKFRGIYMPYWVYSFEKNGPITFSGKKVSRRGDYRITKHYKLDCEVDEAYKGLAFDASSSFSDNLSGAIAPFDLKEGKPFAPTFLSGFYADTSDVEKYVYESDAEKIMLNDVTSKLASKSVCRRYNVGEGSARRTLRNALRPTTSEAQLAMLPVWFLSYRKNDRMCYAVVNGQTGKVAADLPIDLKKYVMGSAVLAVPLFFLLNIFYTFTPITILLLAIILALSSLIIVNSQMNRIVVRERREDDKGLNAAKMKFKQDVSEEEDDNLAEEMAAGREQAKQQKAKNDANAKALKWILISLGVFASVFILPYVLFAVIWIWISLSLPTEALVFLVVLGFVLLCFALCMVFRRKNKSAMRVKAPFKQKLPTIGKPLAGITLALFILLFNPVADWFYYIGAIVCMGSVGWSFTDIIKQHNVLTTRKLPQFNKRGGDELA